MQREERRPGAARFVTGARWVGFVVVLAASSRAAADAVPSFKDSCRTSRIESPCTTQEGLSGTCIPAECRQTANPLLDPLVDVFTIVACTPCAICEPPGRSRGARTPSPARQASTASTTAWGLWVRSGLRQTRFNSGSGARRPHA